MEKKGQVAETQDVKMRTESNVSQNDNEMSQATDNSKASGPRKRNRKRKPTGGNDKEESKDQNQKPRPQTAQPNRNNNQKQGGQQQQASDKQYQVKGQHQNKGGNQDRQKRFENEVENATEEGFTGDRSGWFDEKAYKASMFADFDKSEHDYYYGSYSHFHIHEEMLKDATRTRTYRAAIENNPMDFKDKIVLDIGAGTGILSIFAARAGAKHVYAIENAEIAHFAREIVKRNGLESKITVIKGKMEEIVLPVPKVDIIISEWMGYMLFYESMLDCVLWARDKYLCKENGKMLPDRCSVFVAAIEDGDFKNQKKNFWKDVYGVDMSVMTPTVMKEPLVDYVNKDMIMSDSCKILDIDLVTCAKEDVNFSSKYSLKMRYNDKVHGLVSWFDTAFSQLTHPTVLSTSPYRTGTHWKQTVLYLEQDLEVKTNEVLNGSIAVRQSTENFRELDIKISYHFEGQQCKKHFQNLYKLR